MTDRTCGSRLRAVSNLGEKNREGAKHVRRARFRERGALRVLGVLRVYLANSVIFP